MNTDDMKFDKLVGMLKAEEMEASIDLHKPSKGVVLAASGSSELRIK